MDAGGGDMGEEGEQVDPDNHRLRGVGGGEGVRGAAGYEAVGGGVDWDGAEDLGEEPALQGAEPGLGCLDQPAVVGPAVVVVVQPVGGGASVHGASVGVPVEVFDAQVEHRGQVADVVDERGVPGPADGAGRRHRACMDEERSLVLVGGGDCRAERVEGAQEGGQLAWPVGGWVRVGDQHRVGDRPQPPPPDAEDEPTLVDEIGARSRCGESRGAGSPGSGSWSKGDRCRTTCSPRCRRSRLRWTRSPLSLPERRPARSFTHASGVRHKTPSVTPGGATR
jgi:hypothetical protein